MSQVEQPDFAQALSHAIKQRGLSLERIKYQLEQEGVSVSVATLSYWQNGRSQPTRGHSRDIVTSLERILELPSGQLVNLVPLPPPRSRKRWSARRKGISLPEAVDELLAEVGIDHRALRKLSTQLTLCVGRDRSEHSEVVRNLVQCTVEGTDRFPIVGALVVTGEEGRSSDQGADQTVEGLSNCQVGEVYEDEEHQLVLTEMRLPRRLTRGELVMVEYQTTWSGGGEASEGVQLATGELGQLVLEAQFDPRALPRSVHYQCTNAPTDELGPEAVGVPLAGALAQVVRLDAPAGIHSLQWQW